MCNCKVSVTLDVSACQGDDVTSIATGGAQIFTTIGNYKGNIVAVRKITILKVDINRTVLLEFKEV